MDIDTHGEGAVDPSKGLTVLSSRIDNKLETLKSQYENQLANLRSEIDRSRQRRRSKEDGAGSGDGSSSGGGDSGRDGQALGDVKQLSQMKDSLSSQLPGEQKDQLETLVTSIDQQYQTEIEDMHRQHVDGVEEQVKAMRSTLEEIYNSQVELMRSELEQSHESSMHDLRDTLDKQHKEELNKLEQEVKAQLEDELEENLMKKLESDIKTQVEEELKSKVELEFREKVELDVKSQMKEEIKAELEKDAKMELEKDIRIKFEQEIKTQVQAEFEQKLEDQKQEYEIELKAKQFGDTLVIQTAEAPLPRGKTDSEDFITNLGKRLTEEHRKIIQKIETDIANQQLLRERASQDSQTDDTDSAVSAPVTKDEYRRVQERHGVLQSAEDVQRSLTAQLADIEALRTQMLGEYDQMLSVRTEVMAAQSDEVGKLQEEMARIQEQYEQQMAEFQDRVRVQTETSVRSELSAAHSKELEDMKTFYETKVADMEKSYTTDIAQLKQEHAELIARLHQETNSATAFQRSPPSSPGKQREYVHKTTTLTAISDEEEEMEDTVSALASSAEGRPKTKTHVTSEKSSAFSELEGRLKMLESRLHDKETIIDELKKRLEQETTSAEDLHEKLLDSNKTLEDMEDNLKARSEEIENLKKELTNKDNRIVELEEEKAALEEKGEKDSESKESDEKLVKELRDKVKQLEEELSASKQVTDKIASGEKLAAVEKEQEVVEDAEVSKESVEALMSPVSTIDREAIEAAIREQVRNEILQEYEESIDKLKCDYEERISDLNNKLQTLESQGLEKADEEKDGGDSETSQKETLRAELALEFKQKLESVTDEYETKLKHLQDIVDGRKSPVKVPPPPPMTRSRSLDRMTGQQRLPQEYEGYVSTIRREYEDRINSLQKEIAQYKSSVGPVPLTPLLPISPKAQLAVAQTSDKSDSPEKLSPMKAKPDSGASIPVKPQTGSVELRQEVYDEIAKEFELSFKNLKENYERQLDAVNAKLESLQSDSAVSGDIEGRIRAEVAAEYEEKIEKLKAEYEAKIAKLEKEHELEVSKLTAELDKARADKVSAEQKVKADMFVWHEEIVTQLKRQHEENISQLRREFEEKMELYKEEVQEEFDGEKAKIEQGHRRELHDWEEKYDTLVEGLRTGEAPEVAELVQEKYDMELEMAKTLIQQECDETIESEQSRLSEEFDEKVQEIIAQKDKELAEQKAHYEKIIAEKDQQIAEQQARHEKELDQLRTNLLQQYESQIIELRSQHQAELLEAKQGYETLLKGEKEPLSDKETLEKLEDDDVEKDEDQEKVTSSSTGSRSSKDDDDDDGKDGGTGGSKTSPRPAESSSTDDVTEAGSKTLPDSTESADEADGGGQKEVQEMIEKKTVEEVKAVQKAVLEPDSQTSTDGETQLVQDLRQELEDKAKEYESSMSEMQLLHEKQVEQLTSELSALEVEYEARLRDMEEKHEMEVRQYEDTIQSLRDGADIDDTEAMEAAHQQELRDLEERLNQKHMNELNNLATQHQTRLDDMEHKYMTDAEDLKNQLLEAQKALEHYRDTMSQGQSIPSFHGESTMDSTKDLSEDVMVRSDATTSESDPAKSDPITVKAADPTDKSKPDGQAIKVDGGDSGRGESDAGTVDKSAGSQDAKQEGDAPIETDTMETQVFSARTNEDITTTESTTEGPKVASLAGTLDEVEIQSLDTSFDKSRGTLRGVDDTMIDTELIHFSEEDTDKSMEEDTHTAKSDRSTPPAMLQTLGYGADVPGGPTVKSLDDTTDSSIRASEREDKEDLRSKVKALEAEVEDLRHRLQGEVSKQDDILERLDREKQEERNLATMLREDIERLNNDREALQATNEHLLGLLSDAVKTYMSVDESITRKMKVMMERGGQQDKGQGQGGRPGSADRKKTSPTPGKKSSPSVSPGRLSPARAEDADNVQETSILSNVTDEGLDVSSRLADSLFQGPDLASEEEELLIDSGSRLRTSVTHLLDMIEETTSQLLETRHTQADMVDTIEGKGEDVAQLASRCSDLEDRLREEVERKDFLAMELHKAEGLIEGYASERETLEQKIQDLEEQKETLVLDLESTQNKLHDLESFKSENDRIKQEMKEQRDLLSTNVGDEAQATRAQPVDPASSVEEKALILEVSRLNSENREREEQIRAAHERYESRVRDLETSGEDMEHHYGKLLDDKKQEAADLRLQVDALEKQLKAKKAFIEEQSAERDQEHDDYQRDLEHWKKLVHDLEKQNGTGSRLQREVDELTEQLSARIDQHTAAQKEAEGYIRELQDRDLSIKELKVIIHTLETDLQEKTAQLDASTVRLKKLEGQLSEQVLAEDDLSDSASGTPRSARSPGTSLEFGQGSDARQERAALQMTVEEEMRQAANKTKEELVREKFALQTQVNDNIVQLSSLRTQLDEMRYRRGLVPGADDTPDAAQRLKLEREKVEDLEKQISELKQKIEDMTEKLENRDQQIEQLCEQRDRSKLTRGSPVEGIEYEADREVDRQMQALQRENKQLKERVKLAEVSSTTDMSGLSQNLIDEKNQEIDHLSEELLRLQADLADLKAEKGVENLYDQFEQLKEDLRTREQEITDLQNVRGSAAFTDHSLTPDSSLMNVGASFSEKASIQQEMQESVATNLEKVANLETELSSMKTALQSKEEHIVSLEQELSSLREDLQAKDEKIESLENKPEEEDEMSAALLQEKEGLITQLTVEVESLQTEVSDLSEFQTKLQEDYEMVQNMLEEKYREIESLTRELTEKSPGDSEEHALVIKHEVEIARLKKDLREKDNVIDEKMEEIAEMTDKLELLESHIAKYKEQVEDYDEQILDKEKTIKKLRKDFDHATLTPDEKDQTIEQLKRELEAASLGRPPSPPRSEDEKSVIEQQNDEIRALKEQVQKLLEESPDSKADSEEDLSTTIERQQAELEAKKYELEAKVTEIQAMKLQVEAASLGRPPTPPEWEEEGESKGDLIRRLKTEIERLKQQILDSNLPEDEKNSLIRNLRLENETLKRQIDAALKIRPPSPPMEDDEKSELIRELRQETVTLKQQVESALSMQPPSPMKSEDSQTSDVIRQQEKEIARLKTQVEAALQIAPPPPPLTEDEKDTIIEEKEMENSKLREEIDRITQSIENGDSQSPSTVASLQVTLELKEQEIQKLQEELESVKEVKAYEDEIERQEKEDELEELRSELERYRSQEDSTIGQSVDLELSSGGTPDSKQLVRSMSFYKEQYEEKCGEARQLQVQLDLVKQQLENARSDRLEDAGEELELFKADLERKSSTEVKELEAKQKDLETEKQELQQELKLAREQLGQTADERIATLEKELTLTKDQLAEERKDNVQAINDMEKLRERKEKERRGSLKTIQDLENDLEEKISKEKELHNQVRQLSEELTVIKRQYGIEEKPDGSEGTSRSSPKSGQLSSDGSFELGTDVDSLQQQVLHFKQHADKAKDILSEKQKYQSQLVKLEIQHEQLQKTMRKEVARLEEQLKTYATQPDQDVWTQLHATQDRLEKTTEKLGETADRLQETESNLTRVGRDLALKDSELKDLQKELWQTSSQLSTTSGKLQETEQKLRQALGQVTEREDQIHQLQGELQHSQHEAEQQRSSTPPEEVEQLRHRLRTAESELEEVKTSLKEAVSMSEQQLQVAEDKDQAFVQLKLDIQSTIADKDKLIREQKQQIKEKDQEVKKVKQEVQEKEREVTKVKKEAEAKSREATPSEDSGTLVSLRSQLKNQEELIASLQSDLVEARSSVSERDSELESLHRRHEETRKDSADTVEAFHNQIAGLQEEVQSLRSAVKSQSDGQGQGSRSPSSGSPGSGGRRSRSYTLDDARGQSPFDQNGHRNDAGSRRAQGDSDVAEMAKRSSPTDGAEFKPPSPRQQRVEDLQRQHWSPDQSRRTPDDLRLLEDSNRGRTPEMSAGQTFMEQGRSFDDQEDSGHQSFEPSGRGRSPTFSPDEQVLARMRLRPHVLEQVHSQPELISRAQSQQTSKMPVPASPPTRDRPDDHQARSGSEGQRSPDSERSRRSSPRDGDDGQGQVRRSSPREQVLDDRSSQGAAFALDSERLVYDPRSPVPHASQQRFVADEGQLYDRDDNIRPRYSHSAEGQGDIDYSQNAAESRVHIDRAVRHHSPPTQTRTSPRSAQGERGSGDMGEGHQQQKSPRSHRGQGEEQAEGRPVEGQGSGISSEAEGYIQQLRRELLITKTALMQIQKGERLDDREGQDDIEFPADAMATREPVAMETIARFDHGHGDTTTVTAPTYRPDVSYEALPDHQDLQTLKKKLEKAQEELDLFRTSSNLSARDFVQKVMNLKDELSNEHQRHVQELTSRAQHDSQLQLETMRLKYMDEIEHIKRLADKDLEHKLGELRQQLERKHKADTNRLVIQHQEEVATVRSRAGLDYDDGSVHDRMQRQREDGVGADHGLMNGHSTGGAEPMSSKLQGILRKLHNEGVQVLTISELELLNRRQSQGDLPPNADLESMKAGWENERQTMISTIQSLKDLLAQTHKLRGLDKDDDDDDDDLSQEGSDWRAELLRAIGYVFTKERDSLLAELRSHVLSYPSANIDEIQRLEQKIRNMESQHHAAQEQIFNADRQSMLAEIRDMRAHATIARMSQQEERDRYNEKLASAEDAAVKKERQLKRQVQLLEFKIQQEKVLQDDLRTSLDLERNRSSDLSGELTHEKSSNLDLQSNVASLQSQVAKLRENLEREQSRYVSVTNALEEEKSKSLNLSDLLEAERQSLWRAQAELETLKQQGAANPQALEQLTTELNSERELRLQAQSQHEIDQVTVQNLKQDVEMSRHRQHAVETEMTTKINQLQRALDSERQKQSELTRALERERSLCSHLQQTLDAEKSNSERQNSRDQVAMEDLLLQLETERANLDDLNTALTREQRGRAELETERNLLKDHLTEERRLNEELKQDFDKVQYDRLEAVNKLQKEHDVVSRLKSDRDQLTEDLRALKSREIQRDRDRETERLADRKLTREADREKEDYKMKLHEQQLELERLGQKLQGLEEQLSASRENELKVIRELEHLKLDLHDPDTNTEMVSVQTSPRRDLDSSLHDGTRESRERYNVYRSQLESMCQSLHYLILRCREQLNKATHSSSRHLDSSGDFDSLQVSLRDLLDEVKRLQEMEGELVTHPSSSVTERVRRQNAELTDYVWRISEEKTELRNTLTQLEEEIHRFRQMEAKFQAMQRSNDVVDHKFISEKADWAKEKLSLQMRLTDAEREIGLLQSDLRSERDHRATTGNTTVTEASSDKAKVQRIYGKYLRAESFRKMLIYQKKYLLLLLGGYQDSEETTLALLSRMGATEAYRHSPRRTRQALLTTFRGAVRVVIAIQRMKFLVCKWRRATRVGSEVVSGAVDQANGYVPSAATYSPPRHGSTPRQAQSHVRSISSPPIHTSTLPGAGAGYSPTRRAPSPARIPMMPNDHVANSSTASYLSPRFDMDAYSSSSYQSASPHGATRTSLAQVPFTPPTKDYGSSSKYTSHTAATGARRKILTSSIPISRTSQVRFTSTSPDASNGALGENDDYIHRLENLQTRLGTLQNGRRSSYRQAWR